MYRLLYYYQTDTPPYLFASPESMAEYIRLLGIIKQELLHPVADTYNLIVSVPLLLIGYYQPGVCRHLSFTD